MVDIPFGDDFVFEHMPFIKDELHFHLLPPLCEIIESYLDTRFFIISSEDKRISARRSEIGVCKSFQQKLQNDPLAWKEEHINLTTIELKHLILFLHSLAQGYKTTDLPKPLGDKFFSSLQPWEVEFLKVVLEGKSEDKIVPEAFCRKKDCIFHLLRFANQERLESLVRLLAALMGWAIKATPKKEQLQFLRSLS